MARPAQAIRLPLRLARGADQARRRAASMAGIARRLGVAKPTLYRMAGSREELIATASTRRPSGCSSRSKAATDRPASRRGRAGRPLAPLRPPRRGLAGRLRCCCSAGATPRRARRSGRVEHRLGAILRRETRRPSAFAQPRRWRRASRARGRRRAARDRGGRRGRSHVPGIHGAASRRNMNSPVQISTTGETARGEFPLHDVERPLSEP